MTLIVEDGTGKDNAESYVSVADADAYLTAYRFPPPTAWLGARATGQLSLEVQPTAAEQVVVGSRTYTWRTSLSAAHEVLIGATVAASRQNLHDAINLTGSIGVQYGIGTTANPEIEATGVQGNVVNVRARTAGDGGNDLPTTETMTWAGNSWGSATLTGGSDPALSTEDKEVHLRLGTRWVEGRLVDMISGQGYAVNPDQAFLLPMNWIYGKNQSQQLTAAQSVALVRPAVCIMALRSAQGDDLIQDTQDSAPIMEKSVRVDVISISKVWGGGESPQKDYALANQLLYQAFGISGSRVSRS